MKIENFLQTKSKEEVGFILYNNTGIGYKINCLDCNFFKKNKNGFYKCSSLLESACRQEYYDLIKQEMPDR